MSSRSVVGHVVLALVGLGLAFGFYLRSKSGSTTNENEVLLDVHKRDIQRLVWSDVSKTITVDKRQGDDGEPYYWITSETTAGGKTQKKELRASAEVDKLLESFAPWRAVRALGLVSAEKLKEFGLEASNKSVTVATPGGEHKVIIGDTEYGADQRYVQDGRDSHVYLVRAFVVSNLENAPGRYMERSLHRFNKTEIESATITAGDKSLDVVQKNRLEPGKSFWARKSDAAKRDDLVGNWMDKVLALNALEYAPAETAATPVVRITFHDDRNELGTLELLKAASADGKTTDWYAKTRHTIIPVKVRTNAEEIAKDVDKILSQ